MEKKENELNFTIPATLDKSRVLLAALHSENLPFLGESHGVCVIAGHLKAACPGINVTVMDGQLCRLEDVIAAIKKQKPAMVGISIKIQTFNQFRQLYQSLQHVALPGGKQEKPLLVVGHSIANYNSREILEEYAPDIIVGTGEGELSLEDLYFYLHRSIPLEKVRNIVYMKNGKVHYNKREYLAQQISLPDRTHSATFYRAGGEVYVEGSRGCPYGACSICATRDFLGSRKKKFQWRPREISLIIQDLHQLEKMGIQNVTFTDEEFFGFDTIGTQRLQKLGGEIIKNRVNVDFRINARISSLAPEDVKKRNEVKNTLVLLKKSGLKKIFLGLESGVETQLKRYQKGFNIKAFIRVKTLLEQLRIDYEIGFILFDPLMSFIELEQDLKFIKNTNLIENISTIAKELRVQVGLPYLEAIRETEEKLGKKILGNFDFNSQCYQVSAYLDQNIDFIVKKLREWERRNYKLYYLLRILTHYGLPEDWRQKDKDSSSPGKKEFFFKILKELKYLEFELLCQLASMAKQKGTRVSAGNLMQTFERKRYRMIRQLLLFLKANPRLDPAMKLFHEADGYIRHSQQLFSDVIPWPAFDVHQESV